VIAVEALHGATVADVGRHLGKLIPRQIYTAAATASSIVVLLTQKHAAYSVGVIELGCPRALA